jgi:hypothetical protein
VSDDLKLKIEIDATGAARAASEINKVTDATKKTTEATKANAQAVDAQKKAVEGATPKLGDMGRALGIAGNTVGQFSQGAGQMVSRLGQLGGAMQSLTTAGLGPLGIALAAVNIAVAAFNTVSDEAADTTRRMGAEASGAAGRIRELASAYAAAREGAAMLARIRAGEGTADEQRAALADVMRRRDEARARRESATSGIGSLFTTDTQRRAMEMQEEALAREEDRLREAQRRQENFSVMVLEEGFVDFNPAQPDAPAAPRSRGGGRGAMTAQIDAAAEEKRLQLIAQVKEQGMREAAEAEERARQEAAFAAIEAQKERDAEEYEARMQAEQKITELLAEEEQRRTEAAQEANEQRIQAYQNTADMIASIGSSTIAVAGFVDDVMAKADESDEQRQKRMLKRKAFDQSIEGIINTANSAASFARMDYPAGVTYAVAAGLNFAAAAKAGVDAGNVRAAGPSGGGDGGQQRRDNTQRESAEPKTIVINMNGPVVAATDRAELGRQLGQLVNEGQQRYG